MLILRNAKNSKSGISNFSSILASKIYIPQKKKKEEKEITFDAIFLNCNST